MAGRLIAGLPKSVDISNLSFQSARRRRRAFAAFVTGAALFAAGGVTLHANVAGAKGGGRGLLAALFGGADGANSPNLVEIPIDPKPATPRKNHARAAATPLASRRPVCVRLCDGFFFPVGPFSGGQAIASADSSCAGICPDAPTALYFLPPGSDRIEDATSTSGARYTALPVSLRYRTTLDGACACRRAVGQTPPYWQDPTLRKGDAVMTAGGFVVFRGAGHAPYSHRDFTTLAAASIPGDRRATLMAIERVSARTPSDADRFRVAVAATRPNAKARGAGELRFAAPPLSATN
jgi:hypothetical protein